jgi:hypothetical protein
VARAGTWVVFLCTEPFRALAEVNARALGVADLDIFVVPGNSPLGAREPIEVEELGRRLATHMMTLASQPALRAQA